MGNDLSPHQYEYSVITELEQETHFTKHEITALHKHFSKLANESKEDTFSINKEQFADSIRSVLSVGNVKEKILMNLFDAWDEDQNHMINFHEFVVGLSVISRGSLNERIKRKKRKGKNYINFIKHTYKRNRG